MKENVKSEYFRRLHNVLKSKLNGKNVTAINSGAVSLIRYTAGIVK